MEYFNETQVHRIGLIVPSSNITMETEIPALLRWQEAHNYRHRFTFHSARIRLQQVTREALSKMNDEAFLAADALSDAGVDAYMYACLVALMAGGKNCIESMYGRLKKHVALHKKRVDVVTSAGALIHALKFMKAEKVSIIAPYKRELTSMVTETIEEEGIRVVQSHSLEVVDNAEVGRLNTEKLLKLASQLDLTTSDALIISACVQMPSLPVIERAEQKLGLPVISAATASTFQLLQQLNIQPQILYAGELLRPSSIFQKTFVDPSDL